MGLIGDPSLAGFETGRSASEDAAGPPPASPVCRSRSGGAALGSAGKPPLGGVRLRSSLSDGPDPADEDPRCLIRNLDDGRESLCGAKLSVLPTPTATQIPKVAPPHRSKGRAQVPAMVGRAPSGEAAGSAASAAQLGSLVTHSRDRSSSDEKDTSSEKGGHHSSSATDDSQDSVPRHGPARVKVRQYGKSYKELSGLFMTQEIHAHNGSIWSIKFSPDGRYLASAGEDCIIHVWEVLEFKRAGKEREVKENGVYNPLVAMVYSESSETMVASGAPSGSHWEKKLRSKGIQRMCWISAGPNLSLSLHQIKEVLLSSSMDKTVRLWHMSSTYCLKTFSHTDYVTCIQFNPVDDRYFISGSLDEKVRIWSIPKREIVDWVDLHEMVTAACYTPDGKGALIGSHKGSCHCMIHLFVPGDSSMVIITSADSRIRVLDGFELVHRLKLVPVDRSNGHIVCFPVHVTLCLLLRKGIIAQVFVFYSAGFRNTSSQISACLAGNGRYIISASEDSRVYIWRNDDGSKPSKKKGIVSVTNTHEHFHCESVTVAVTWPFTSTTMTSLMNPRKQELERGSENGYSPQDLQTKLAKAQEMTDVEYRRTNITSYNSKHNSDRTSPAWPEELVTPPNQSLSATTCHANEGDQALNRSAWA
ncbi:WD repeat-containing protein 44 [Zea mays]|uniref:WD repeat-containing protein 44 n=1 Tax=Zea mays TaxID=4577 RepID=A0A3L6F6T2_MAIZE|nr:WD repeat-containing protein 44 [Zea mays]